MPSLNATNPAEQKEIAHIAFLNLALHTGRPYRICADQTIQQAVISFGDGAREKLLHAPLILHTDENVFKLLVGCQVAGLKHLARTRDRALAVADALWLELIQILFAVDIRRDQRVGTVEEQAAII